MPAPAAGGHMIWAAAGGGPPLFVVSETSKLRVYVNVPQNYVPNIPIGTKARIAVPEYPGRTFPATVEASAKSVDAASNTTRMQLVVDNSLNELMTGDFTNVTFDLPRPEVTIYVPASALIFNANGLHVAVVDGDGRIELRDVSIARDLGNEVEIGSGIKAADRVVINPPDGIAGGDKVRIAGQPGKPGEPETADAK
jgi:membrane fusion protein (multidrug efflux system)